MPRGTPVDIESLHLVLHDSSDRFGRLELKQADVAERLGITKFTMSRAVARMVAEKRMRRLGDSRYNRGMFVVEDPDTWKQLYDD